MAVSVGGIGMIAVGALLIHASLTNQSPLADFRSLMTGTAAKLPDASTLPEVQTATGSSQVFVNTPAGGAPPLGSSNLNGPPAAASTHRTGL